MKIWYENGFICRNHLINKHLFEIYANTDEKKYDQDYYEKNVIGLAATFKGPVICLLIGYVISIIISTIEYFSYLLFKLSKIFLSTKDVLLTKIIYSCQFINSIAENKYIPQFWF